MSDMLSIPPFCNDVSRIRVTGKGRKFKVFRLQKFGLIRHKGKMPGKTGEKSLFLRKRKTFHLFQHMLQCLRNLYNREIIPEHDSGR